MQKILGLITSRCGAQMAPAARMVRSGSLLFDWQRMPQVESQSNRRFCRSMSVGDIRPQFSDAAPDGGREKAGPSGARSAHGEGAAAAAPSKPKQVIHIIAASGNLSAALIGAALEKVKFKISKGEMAPGDVELRMYGRGKLDGHEIRYPTDFKGGGVQRVVFHEGGPSESMPVHMSFRDNSAIEHIEDGSLVLVGTSAEHLGGVLKGLRGKRDLTVVTLNNGLGKREKFEGPQGHLPNVAGPGGDAARSGYVDPVSWIGGKPMQDPESKKNYVNVSPMGEGLRLILSTDNPQARRRVADAIDGTGVLRVEWRDNKGGRKAEFEKAVANTVLNPVNIILGKNLAATRDSWRVGTLQLEIAKECVRAKQAYDALQYGADGVEGESQDELVQSLLTMADALVSGVTIAKLDPSEYVPLPGEGARKKVKDVPPSSLTAVMNGERTELPHILGEFIKMAEKAKVEVPLLRELFSATEWLEGEREKIKGGDKESAQARAHNYVRLMSEDRIRGGLRERIAVMFDIANPDRVAGAEGRPSPGSMVDADLCLNVGKDQIPGSYRGSLVVCPSGRAEDEGDPASK